MKTIWVTGGKGQLGTELSMRTKFLPDYKFAFTDIGDFDLNDTVAVEDFMRKVKPEFIINCAAYTAVDKAETETGAAYSVNRDVPALLMKMAKESNTVIIHISTEYVFDGNTNKPYTEADATNPLSVYGKSKLDGENEILRGENNIVIRTSWLYSSHGNNFVKTIIRLGKERDELRVVDDEMGSPTWAGDLATAILQVIAKIRINPEIPRGIYQYCNNGECSRYEFAVEILRQAGISCRVEPIKKSQYPLPAKRPTYAVMDKSKFEKVFALTFPAWQKSLEHCIKELFPG